MPKNPHACSRDGLTALACLFVIQMYYMSREFNNAVTETPLLLWNNSHQVEVPGIRHSTKHREQLGSKDGTNRERQWKRIGRRLGRKMVAGVSGAVYLLDSARLRKACKSQTRCEAGTESFRSYVCDGLQDSWVVTLCI